MELTTRYIQESIQKHERVVKDFHWTLDTVMHELRNVQGMAQFRFTDLKLFYGKDGVVVLT